MTYKVVSGKNTLRASIKEPDISSVILTLEDTEAIVPDAYLSAAKTIAERNIGTKKVDPFTSTKMLDQILVNTSPVWKIYNSIYAVTDSLMKVAAAFLKGKMQKDDLPKAIGTAARITQKTLADDSWDYKCPSDDPMTLPYFEDVVFEAENIEIRRSQYMAVPEGLEKRVLPWIIKIRGEMITLSDIQIIDLGNKIERTELALTLKTLN